MSATITYKGETLATAENETVVLDTAGCYMEDDITITDETSGGGSPDPGTGPFVIELEYVEDETDDIGHIFKPNKTFTMMQAVGVAGRLFAVTTRNDGDIDSHITAICWWDTTYQWVKYKVREIAYVPSLEDTFLVERYFDYKPNDVVEVDEWGTTLYTWV